MKSFEQQKYPFVLKVYVLWADGLSHIDEIKGLNKGHALKLARENWPGAAVCEYVELKEAVEVVA
jgi:hypothetical protein